MGDVESTARRATPFPAILAITFLGSLGTGMLWSAMPFITKEKYQYTPAENFALFGGTSAMYIFAALWAGSVLRFAGRWAAPRLVIAQIFAAQAAACVIPALFDARWVPWAVAIVFSLSSALLWPTVESYLTSGRHGAAMRNAIGWWNITWTIAVIVPLWLMAPLMKTGPEKAIIGLGIFLLAGLIPLAWFSTHPAPHDIEGSRQHQTDEYPMLMRSGRMLLLLSYVVISATGPLLPFLLGERLDVAIEWRTPAASAWMIARVIIMIVMWRLAFWHGRWGTLLLGGLLTTLGFAAVIISPSVWTLLVALVALGTGVGIIYYSTLYYSMTVGAAAVDAGGKFEALIGTGYTAGPAAGLAALYITNAQPSGESASQFNTAIIAMVWIVVAAGLAGAVRPYLEARARRKQLRGQ